MTDHEVVTGPELFMTGHRNAVVTEVMVGHDDLVMTYVMTGDCS